MHIASSVISHVVLLLQNQWQVILYFSFLFSNLQQLNSAQPILKTGRPIVNTANLAANNALQQHQVLIQFTFRFEVSINF